MFLLRFGTFLRALDCVERPSAALSNDTNIIFLIQLFIILQGVFRSPFSALPCEPGIFQPVPLVCTVCVVPGRYSKFIGHHDSAQLSKSTLM